MKANSVVYKYPLEFTDDQTVELPVWAEILTVALQDGRPCLWAKVNPNEPNVCNKRIRIAGTGHPLREDRDYRYLSTVFMANGSLVFHAFEELS